jgi:hypothetical protein
LGRAERRGLCRQLFASFFLNMQIMFEDLCASFIETTAHFERRIGHRQGASAIDHGWLLDVVRVFHEVQIRKK